MHASNELYDRACELLFAAQELRRAAAREGIDEAVPATLGCIGETLAELARVTRRLAEESAAAPEPWGRGG